MSKKSELHQKQNGICPVCISKNDIKVMTFASNEQDKLICLPCFNNASFDTPYIDDSFLKTICSALNATDEVTIKETLLNFHKNFALVEYNSKNSYRRFWAWPSSNSPFNSVCLQKNGKINRVVLSDGKVITLPVIYSKNKNIHKVRVDERLKHLLKEKKDWYSLPNFKVSYLNIMPIFKNTTPNSNKVGAHKSYYLNNGKFAKPIVVIETGDSFTLLDCYTVYLAALELNVESIDLLVVG